MIFVLLKLSNIWCNSTRFWLMRSMPYWLWAYEKGPYAETYITKTKYQHYQDLNLNFRSIFETSPSHTMKLACCIGLVSSTILPRTCNNVAGTFYSSGRSGMTVCWPRWPWINFFSRKRSMCRWLSRFHAGLLERMQQWCFMHFWLQPGICSLLRSLPMQQKLSRWLSLSTCQWILSDIYWNSHSRFQSISRKWRSVRSWLTKTD